LRGFESLRRCRCLYAAFRAWFGVPPSGGSTVRKASAVPPGTKECRAGSPDGLAIANCSMFVPCFAGMQLPFRDYAAPRAERAVLQVGSSDLARLSTPPPTGASRRARPARAGLPNATPSGRGRLLAIKEKSRRNSTASPAPRKNEETSGIHHSEQCTYFGVELRMIRFPSSPGIFLGRVRVEVDLGR
jgi:hypothetical protein